MGFSFGKDNRRGEFHYFQRGGFSCRKTVLFFLRSNRKFYLKNHTQNNFFLLWSIPQTTPAVTEDLLLSTELGGKKIVGEFGEHIPFSNLQYLLPMLKAQLCNIYKPPSDFALPISSWVMFAFSVLSVFSPSED